VFLCARDVFNNAVPYESGNSASASFKSFKTCAYTCATVERAKSLLAEEASPFKRFGSELPWRS